MCSGLGAVGGVCGATNSMSRESRGQESVAPSRAGMLLDVVVTVCGMEEKSEGCTVP